MKRTNTWFLILSVFVLFSVSKRAYCTGEAEGGDWLSIPEGAYFTGSPTYISEFEGYYRDNGGPLSDLGSHCGIKSHVHNKDLASIRHFAAVTGAYLLDYSRTGLFGVSHVELLDESGEKIDFKERRIIFDYVRWREETASPNIRANAFISFLKTDSYVLEFSFLNSGTESINFCPTLVFKNSGKRRKSRLDESNGVIIENFFAALTPFPRKNYFAVAPGFSVRSFDISRDKSWRLSGEYIELGPKEEFRSFIVFSYSADSEGSAINEAVAARDGAEQGSRAYFFEKAGERWKKLVKTFSRPHVSDPAHEDLFLMSIAALEMAVYSPRDKMQTWGCVPSKGHYNWFWLWDSGFQSLGYAEKDPVLAEDVVMTIFSSQRDDGYIAHMTNDKLKPISPHSQSPVFGYTTQKILPYDPDESRRREFIRGNYEHGGAYFEWWEKARDRDKDGLFEFLSQDESGWDNSPRARYVPPIVFISYYGMLGELIGSRTKPLNSVDANSWMYLYCDAMSEWARELGLGGESGDWSRMAEDIAQKMDEVLWSEDCGCWLDAYKRKWKKDYRHFKVLTPHIWFPAWAGATRDEAKARRVIEEHLLNPEEFFGRYPMPTVAYNDPLYDPSIPGWTGDIWILFNYFALETLYRYGYLDEAMDLKQRTLDMMSEQGGMKGIYENYDPRTGSYKDEDSTGGYCTFQFGWSSAFTLGIILDRWQEKRFIFNDTKELSGYLREAERFSDRDIFIEVSAERDPPFIEIKSADGLPLLESKRLRVKVSDPYGSIESKRFPVRIKGREYILSEGVEKVILIDRG